MKRPVIGITCDTRAPHPDDLAEHWRYESHATNAAAVADAGGTPILLPFEVERIADYLAMCDGVYLAGGDDPDTTAFGVAVHPTAKLVRPQRQRFEIALIEAMRGSHHAVLGVCLGMQWMALAAGGRLHQHLPEVPGVTPEQARTHRCGSHRVDRLVEHDALPAHAVVFSHHHQAVDDPGSLRILARSEDGVAEAIDDPRAGGRFYLGVQWHPERTEAHEVGAGLLRRFVEAASRRG